MKSKTKKILPIVVPPITTFPPYAAMLSILYNYEEAYDWMFSQYIQIYAIDKTGRNSTDSAVCQCFFGDFDTRRLACIIADHSFLRDDLSQIGRAHV